MRVLVLGGDGMLGHQLLKRFSQSHETRVTLRGDLAAYERHGLFTAQNSYAGVDARDLERLLEICGDFRPDTVINAVGIVKQRRTAKESVPSLEVNSLLPHRLAVLTAAIGARLVHFSTDCVFSGIRGNYREEDFPDAADLYGRSKLLGEVVDSGCLTLRTSIIGPELSRFGSLVEWFLRASAPVSGFRRAIFTGFTTHEFARVVEWLLMKQPHPHGLWHVSSDPISKYDLLCGLRDRLRPGLDVLPDDDFHCDRSLDSSRFRETFGYRPPDWDAQLDELARELAHH